MNNLRKMLALLMFSGFMFSLNAKNYVPEGAANPTNNPNTSANNTASYRADCSDATAQTDLNINNVRARLLNGGDMWWNFSDGVYIVPKVSPGEEAVSSLFAGAVWLGGFDDGGNLKLAAQTYRTGGNDFWPGPLEPNSGEITDEACSQWDRHFTVYGDSISRHIAFTSAIINAGGTVNCDDVADDLKRWPGQNNPHFADYYNFELPADQPLAPFYDRVQDGVYDPCDGDFPVIEVRGCDVGETNEASIADQMTFWVYNDNGNIHTQTTGDPIRMEVQVQAFGYATSDEVNNMTFYRYKLINRANSPIDSTYFTMWIDGDLGCPIDDYIGSDTSRSMAVYYNQNAVDGAGGCSGTPSYGANPPMLGIDYFRGPLDETGTELGMSSFTYYFRGDLAPNPGMADPQIAVEYYNYMTATWRDGSPYTVGGNGYGGTIPTQYVYVEDPPLNGGNSMCAQGVNGADVRTLQSSGPFRLNPGAVNELIIGVAWVPNLIDYPCPSFRTLQGADDLAQALFDNCFKITDGPDAPSMDIVELDKELVIVLSNDASINSNNVKLQYAEKDLKAPPGTVDSMYLFEGYKVYQVSASDVTLQEIDNPEKARLIYQVDLNNGVDKVYNWDAFEDAGIAATPVFIPNLEVDGGDQGVGHTLKVTEDQFAESNRGLVNHKKYYFLAVAYAYNNYEAYDPVTNVGQRDAYLQGRRNIGSDGAGRAYVGIPRITAPEYEGLALSSAYGDGPSITRLDGAGTGTNFLRLTEETVDKIVNNNTEDVLVYQGGFGPINVKVVDPIRVQAGDYTLDIIDENLANEQLDDTVRWVLSDNTGEQWFSETSLDIIAEQVILERGISLTIGQVIEPGVELEDPNGFIDATSTFDGTPWASFAGNESFGRLTRYIEALRDPVDPQTDRDADAIYSNVLGGAWVPYTLLEYRTIDATGIPFADQGGYLTPAWINSFGNLIQNGNPLANLNNIDVIMTSDKTKWTRCPVVETANNYHADAGFVALGTQMDLRNSPSVGTDGQPDGDGDGMSWFPGYAIDVETGQRLNLFFGENTIYDGVQFPISNGIDMLWNPTDDVFVDLNGNGPDNIGELVMGSQHYVYVTNTTYDNGAALRGQLGGSGPQKVQALRNVQWISFPVLATGAEMASIGDGLIPNTAEFNLRVNNPYVTTPTSDGRSHPNSSYPRYTFNLDALTASVQQQEVAEEALDIINVVPNPYYAYSAYETRRFDNIVKITNLPAKCTVTIYSLDGKFIRQYNRDENPGINSGQLAEQVVTSIEWDLKNSRNIPIAAGVYLIHVDVPGVGERVIKWFGINRTFDAQGL